MIDLKYINKLKYNFISKPIKRIIRNPYKEDRQKKIIIHSCYHKVGTVWFDRILRTVSYYYGLEYQKDIPTNLKNNTEIFFDDHSKINFQNIENYVGSHLIRDPRDVIVSGYFYHLRTEEKWAHQPDEKYGGISYQKYLNNLEMEKGLNAEISRFLTGQNDMSAWDYYNPNIIEIKYEDIIIDEKKYFTQIFEKYNFNREAIKFGLKTANQFSLKNIKKKATSHARSGVPGDWEKYFSKKNKNYFKEISNNLLQKLDYEKDNDW